MATSTLNISLPDTMRKFVEGKIASEGYGTISEYVRELIRADQRAENARFESLIAEAYASGEPSPLTKADIDEARRIVKERIAARKAAK
jgi:antitoxin ParD1/3/4